MRNEDYQMEDGKILIDEVPASSSSSTSLSLRYIYDFETVSKMDPLFIDVLSIELAMKISYRITGSSSNRKELGAMLKDVAPEAYSIDGMERPPTRIERSRNLRARRAIGTSTARHYIWDEEV